MFIILDRKLHYYEYIEFFLYRGIFLIHRGIFTRGICTFQKLTFLDILSLFSPYFIRMSVTIFDF